MNVIDVDFRSNLIHIGNGSGMEASVEYQHLTLERAEEMLDYDPVTGIILWRKRPSKKSRKRVGDLAGDIKPSGYRYIGLDGRMYLGSQIAFLLAYGRWPVAQVGFANKNRCDLSKANLVEMRTTIGKHDLNCMEGRAQYRKDYWANNPEFRRELQFKRLYGIAYADYALMLEAQGGVCAICKRPETSVQDGKIRFLSVDHCHSTGAVAEAVRGLLCMNCNSAIGRLGDDPDMLDRAAAYLRHHAALAAAKKEAA